MNQVFLIPRFADLKSASWPAIIYSNTRRLKFNIII